MTEQDNRQRSQALTAQLDVPGLREIPSRQLGQATYGWLRETKAAPPFDTASGAAQCYNLLRKGAGLGGLNLTRVSAFLGAIEGDPAEFIARWVSQNGSHPAESKPEPKSEPSVEVVLPAELREVLGPIQERYELAEQFVTEKQAELDEAKQLRNTLLAILKAAGIVERKQYNLGPKTEPKKKGKSNSHVSDATAMKILEQIRGYVAAHPPALEDVPGSFTRPLVEKELGLHHSQVGAAIQKLRDQGHIRAAGLTTNDKGNKVNVFAVVS